MSWREGDGQTEISVAEAVFAAAFKIGTLKNFTIFTRPATPLYRDSNIGVFYEYYEIFKSRSF